MATCPRCGSSISFNSKFCQNCGTQLPNVPIEKTNPAPYNPVSYPGSNPYQAQPQPRYYVPQPVTPVPTGGLLAWSIITLLLCLIPGIVAIVKTTGINKATSVEEQQKLISSAKTWCIVGTVLGVLAMIGAVAESALQ